FHVTRTELALENAGQARNLEARCALRTVRVDLGDIGHEHEAAAGPGQHACVVFRCARVVRKVLVRTELHRVDEDARHETLAVAARRLDEAHVPGVQIPHGRDEGDAQALTAPGSHMLADGGDRGDGVQGDPPRLQKQCSGAGYSRALTART